MIDLTVFNSIVTDLPGFITFIILFGLIFLFSSQIVAWVTPPKPKFLHAFAIGMIASSFWIFGIYNYLPLAPAIIRASIHGVYGNLGYFWVLSLISILLVFGLNTFISWNENKPLELIK